MLTANKPSKSRLLVVKCSHSFFDDQGNCSTCGEFIQNIHGMDSVVLANRKTPEKSIMKDLEHQPEPDHIKLKADGIYKSMNCSSKRGACHNLLVFFCVHNAYNENGTPRDPIRLAARYGIPPNEITKAFSMFAEDQTGYRAPAIQATAIDYLPEYCEIFGFSEEAIKDVIQCAEEIIAKAPYIGDDCHPRQLGAAILWHYSTINGIQNGNGTDLSKKKEFAAKLGMTDVTIFSVYKRIIPLVNA